MVWTGDAKVSNLLELHAGFVHVLHDLRRVLLHTWSDHVRPFERNTTERLSAGGLSMLMLKKSRERLARKLKKTNLSVKIPMNICATRK